MADQGLSSLTNFALSLAVARSVSPTGFGAFSLAFAGYLLAMGLMRAVVAQPLVIRYAARNEEVWQEAAGRATGAAVVVGLISSAVALLLALAGSGPFTEAYFALALCAPGLLLQDAWRFAFFAKGRPKSAFANDLLWMLLLFPALGLLMAFGALSVFNATLAWGASATLAALFGIRQSGARPRLSQSRNWWREHRDISPSYIGEFGATAGATQAGMFGVGAVADLAVVGALRAVAVLMGPLKTLDQGLRMVAQPEAVRAVESGRDLLRPTLLLSATLAGIAAAVGGVLMILPDAVGRAAMGETWDAAKPVLLPYTISVMGAGLIGGAQIGLHALVAVRRSLVARVVVSVTLVAGKMIGAVIGGAPAAAAGGAIAMWSGAALWWWQLHRARATATRHPRHEADEASVLNADDLNPERSGVDP